MTYIIYHVQNCFWSLGIAFGLLYITGIKINKNKLLYLFGSTASFVVLYFLPTAINIWGAPNPYLYNFAIRFIALAPWALCLLKGNRIEHLCYILFYISFLKAFIIVFSPLYSRVETMEPVIYSIIDNISFLLQIYLLYLFTMFLKKHPLNTKFLQKKVRMIVLYCPLSFIIILEVANPQNMIPQNNMNALLAVLLLGNIVLVYFFYYSIVDNYQTTIKLNYALEKSKTKIAQYSYSAELEEQLRIERHELKNKYFYLQTLLEENKLDQLGEYLEKQTSQKLESYSKVCTGHKLMDHILNSKLERAEEKNIKIVVDALIPQIIPVKDDMLCTVILNMLDNAIEASNSVNEPEIRISLKCMQNYFVIKVSNLVNNDVIKTNPDLSTSKSDKKKHGYGIKIIKEITKKNEGLYDISSDEESFTFTVMFPLVLCSS